MIVLTLYILRSGSQKTRMKVANAGGNFSGNFTSLPSTSNCVVFAAEVISYLGRDPSVGEAQSLSLGP